MGGFWQAPARIFFQAESGEATLRQWALNQICNLGLIIFVIFCIVIAMRLLKACGFLTLLERVLEPVLPLFDMSRRAVPVTVVGMVMGLAYGGALIIKETITGNMNRREIFHSLALMALSYGLVEDTLLMRALGAKNGGVLWGRLFFPLVVIFVLVRIIDAYPVHRGCEP